MDGWYPFLANKDSSGSSLTGGHLVFVSGRKEALSYSEISADPTIPPAREIVDYGAATSTVIFRLCR